MVVAGCFCWWFCWLLLLVAGVFLACYCWLFLLAVVVGCSWCISLKIWHLEDRGKWCCSLTTLMTVTVMKILVYTVFVKNFGNKCNSEELGNWCSSECAGNAYCSRHLMADFDVKMFGKWCCTEDPVSEDFSNWYGQCTVALYRIEDLGKCCCTEELRNWCCGEYLSNLCPGKDLLNLALFQEVWRL